MKKVAKKHLFNIVSLAVGALAGFFYWKFIGCKTGSYAVTSNSFNSTLYGVAMGGLLLSTLKKTKEYDVSRDHKQR